jgi:hypothetical protein
VWIPCMKDNNNNNNNNNNNSHIGHRTQPEEVLIYKNRTHFTCELTLHVAQTVDTEQLHHCIPERDGLFQVYNCKDRA